jgi:CO/xanthine dehydrogenase FAD-binding subunit
MGLYLRPSTIEQALAALAGRPLVVLAGGTDFYPARVGRPPSEDVLDITAVAGLRGIADEGASWRIGATTTWTELIETPLPPLFDGLKLAAREVGGAQIQNAGTLGGNLCNASPAADGVPPLLALDAEVELADDAGSERLLLSRFIRGNRRTARREQQLLTAIHVPKPAAAAFGGFSKLGARHSLVISIVMAAGVLEVASGRIAAARVAVGACSEVAQRLPQLEAALAGLPIDADPVSVLLPTYLDPLRPIDDVRADAAYRRDAALTIVRRLLQTLAQRARAGA